MRTPLAMALAAILPACAAPETGPSIPGGGVVPLEPTLRSISAVILVPRCATGACHDGQSGTPIDLSSAEAAFTGMVNAASTQTNALVVSPFEPERSYLLVRLGEPLGAAGPMPPSTSGEPLSAEEVTVVSDWIANGASLDD